MDASIHYNNSASREQKIIDWRHWPKHRAPAPDQESRPWRQWPEDFLASQPHEFPIVPEDPSSHAVLEDEALVAWGLANCDDNQGYTTLDVCSVEAGQVEWYRNVDDEKLKILVDQCSDSDDGSQSAFRVFFINTTASETSWLPGNFSMRPSMLQALLKIGLSKVVLSEIFTFEGSFAKMGPHVFESRNTDDSLSRFEMCYRSQSGWSNGVLYIQSIRTATQTIYFCINYPTYAMDRLIISLNFSPNVIHQDLYLDTLAAVDSCRQWREIIGLRRHKLLRHETKYADDTMDHLTLTRNLHRLARDWNTLNQDCVDYVLTLDFLQRAYKKYRKALERSTWTAERNSNTEEYLNMLKCQGENCVRWTSVYRERTNIRINLLFHLANQHEARTSKQIAISTAKVAEQTQRDSSSMITMAAVTMFFLPGTFISAILSTTFFEYGKETLDVSRKWWILPATTIPTTITVFAVWLAWRWWRLRAQRTEMEKYDVGDVVEEIMVRGK
ncbi:unnamed protein product [Periconia digitata]|uniref:Uncharacterized protein n=1 Tax=Periconia digitata TaxID=1303443 RepID=A0A9W4XW28_9PLEO|nr:unnamed protein product [Periconia digitata]